ncbi:MAG: hypothetical protein LBJ44_10660, partial [Propionibacteriaceae bacterium]|nr:hypothetical protein [Propionibacteriaceae bacterium]
MLILITVITIVTVPAVSRFPPGTPLRLIVILLFPVLFVVLGFVFNRLERKPITALGFQRSSLGRQLAIGLALLVVIVSLFEVVPVSLGVSLEDLLPAKDALWF